MRHSDKNLGRTLLLNSSRGFIGIVLVAVLAVGLIAGGVYWVLNSSKLLKNADTYTRTTAALSSASTPDELDAELNALDVGTSVDSDFADIDADLSSL